MSGPDQGSQASGTHSSSVGPSFSGSQSESGTHLLGVDTGGTFTDFVFLSAQGELRVHKVLSTPQAPERAIMQGIRELDLQPLVEKGELVLIHGTTVATNAALQGKGARTAYVTNLGLTDVLTIGRQARRELYNLNPAPVPPPVPSELCLGVGCRRDAHGAVIDPLTEDDLARLESAVEALQPEAIAINLLFSFLDGEEERRIAERLRGKAYISCSSEVLPEYKEYERGIATWLNAWLGPVVHHYLQRLGSSMHHCPVSIMQSSGGTISLDQAADRAVQLLLSGPAGGTAAVQSVARQVGWEKLLSFDMGGTSTDVALYDGAISLTSEGSIAGFPVAVPMVDIHTIGAGGGSIAWVDQGGLLQVGPDSAGADPGPACYGKGGTQLTVTDANLVLGRLPEGVRLAGSLPLDRDRSEKVLQTLAATLTLDPIAVAEGVIAVANEHMARALRVISVHRGEDPENYALCCFGGAGGLHLCELAETLGMRRAVVPDNGGVLSAFGMLAAPRQRNLTRTFLVELPAQAEEAMGHDSSGWQVKVDQALAGMEEEARNQLLMEQVAAEGIEYIRSVACRYRGQSFTLELPWENGKALVERFHQRHEQQYGYRLLVTVELVTLGCLARAEGLQLKVPAATVEAKKRVVWQRVVGESEPVEVIKRIQLVPGERLSGPKIITDDVATLYLKRGWSCSRCQDGHLLLQVDGSDA